MIKVRIPPKPRFCACCIEQREDLEPEPRPDGRIVWHCSDCCGECAAIRSLAMPVADGWEFRRSVNQTT